MRRTWPAREGRGVRRVAQDRRVGQAGERLHQPFRHVARARPPRMGAHRPQPSVRHNLFNRQRNMRPADADERGRLRHAPCTGTRSHGCRGGSLSPVRQREQQRGELYERLSRRAGADGLQLLSVAVSGACEKVSRRSFLRDGDGMHELDARRVPFSRETDVGEQQVDHAGLLQLVLLLGGRGLVAP